MIFGHGQSLDLQDPTSSFNHAVPMFPVASAPFSEQGHPRASYQNDGSQQGRSDCQNLNVIKFSWLYPYVYIYIHTYIHVCVCFYAVHILRVCICKHSYSYSMSIYNVYTYIYICVFTYSICLYTPYTAHIYRSTMCMSDVSRYIMQSKVCIEIPKCVHVCIVYVCTYIYIL